MRFGGVIVEGGSGLGAKVTALGVEIEGADAVGTVGAGELHAALDALDFVGFHWVDCNSWRAGVSKALVGQLR